ncbi:MAG: thioredoxin domain-containing protein [Nanoarchaeota archaeon]|nr:thioredoxin domain-containing protein [Nanoarchaeota archaeon]
MGGFIKALGLSFLLGVSCNPSEAPEQTHSLADISSHQCRIGQHECGYLGYGFSIATPSLEELTPENFDEKVLKSALPATVEFYSPSCAPCMLMKPKYAKVCNEFKERIYCGVYDVDQEEECESPIPPRYEVGGVPALRFFCKGNEVKSMRMDRGWTEEILRYEFKQFLKRCN